MKTRITSLKLLSETFWMIVAFGLIGCDRKKVEPQVGVAPSINSKELITEFSKQTGIIVPVTAILLNTAEGGGRDNFSYRRWLFFSASNSSVFVMPHLKFSPDPERYLEIPVSSSVRMIEGLMGKRKIEKPKAAYHSEWRTNNLEFRGTLVTSEQGTYLLVQQF